MHLYLNRPDSPYHGGDVTYEEHLENARRCAALLKHLLTGWDTGHPDAFGPGNGYITGEATDVADAIDWLESL
jgi:hypothetical protein